MVIQKGGYEAVNVNDNYRFKMHEHFKNIYNIIIDNYDQNNSIVKEQLKFLWDIKHSSNYMKFLKI